MTTIAAGVDVVDVDAGAHANGNALCLRWDDYHSSLSSSFLAFRQDEALVDLTLCCQGRRFGAHKLLLSACSPFFRDLLKDNPCQHPIVILRDDTGHDDLDALLTFVYRGQVAIAEDRLAAFLRAAAALQIKGLEAAPPAEAAAPAKHLASPSPLLSSSDPPAPLAPPPTFALTETPPVKQEVFVSEEDAATIPFLSSSEVRVEDEVMGRPPGSEILPLAMEAAGAEVVLSEKDDAEEKAKREEEMLGQDLMLEGDAVTSAAGDEDFLPAAHPLSAAPPLPSSAPSTSPDPLFHFSHCGRLFHTPSSWARHFAQHHPDTHACRHCSKTFRSRLSLVQHMQVHKGETECRVCGRVFNRRYDLKVHLRGKHQLLQPEAEAAMEAAGGRRGRPPKSAKMEEDS